MRLFGKLKSRKISTEDQLSKLVSDMSFEHLDYDEIIIRIIGRKE